MRIRSLRVQGFRAYGANEQTLNLPVDLAVVWAPNSKGKTSLAEAFEFLLTGRISRRELLASTQDEFADALRNAHIAADTEVYVAARILGSDGAEHEMKRVLTADFGKRQDCSSRLEIDGAVCAEADLQSLGLVLAQPPLSAPVLAQHTLSYIFSVRPQDRATYFKSLLEVTDLDQLRNDIAGLDVELQSPNDPLLAKFDMCAAMPVFADSVGSLVPDIPGAQVLSEQLSDAAAALIKSEGETVPGGFAERITVLQRILTERRSRTFPVQLFERTAQAGWTPPSQETWTQLQTYLEERAKVDVDTRRLVALFDEALKLPVISELTEPIDCFLCGTESALTPERVTLIRRYAEDTREFKTAESAAKTALSRLSHSASSLATGAPLSLPRFLREAGGTRRPSGFRVARIRDLLGDRAEVLVTPWLAQVRPLVRAAARLRCRAQGAVEMIDQQSADLASLSLADLQEAFVALASRREELTTALDTYGRPAGELEMALKSVLDVHAETTGWQEFLDVVQAPDTLRSLLIERESRSRVAKELEAAVRELDRAKEKVLDDKFSDFSDLIGKWWNWLRPDEPTFFAAVKPRPGAKRTIDFKAGLSINPDKSAPKVRDVIAVFSQSQLHCLGLALFLARAEHDGQEFIVLDDPVLSSDEDYRVHFNATVISELRKLPMQVIVLTQDHDTWEEMETRYRHVGISTAQLIVDSPLEGSVIDNTSDALVAKINRARSLARGGHPDSRKECGLHLRDAGERFCKEMLVADCRGKGDARASLTDYDGKALEWLCPRVDPLLDHDSSHPGRLEAFRKYVTSACHDNVPPSTAQMTHACGEITFLHTEYLAQGAAVGKRGK